MWWNLKIVRPKPLPIKNTKEEANKQKPNNACPARMMLIAIKCPLIQRQAALAAIPMLYAALTVYACTKAKLLMSLNKESPAQTEAE